MSPDATPANILRFWFDEVGPDRQFAQDAALDRECARRFGSLRDAVIASDVEGWRGDADALLATIILIDQLPTFAASRASD